MTKVQTVKKVDKNKKATIKDNPIGSNVELKRKCPSRSLKSKEFWKKTRRGRKGKKEPRGVVYLSHIPHGFYHKQIEEYFQQFGKVTAVSVPESKSGNSRGYAFVEFLHPEVAEIAADTMNNYLMFNRVIKAKYIPPNEQKPRLLRLAMKAKRQHRTLPEKFKLAVTHNRMVKNRRLKDSLEVKLAARLKRKNEILKSTLSAAGLNYDFQVERGNIDEVFQRNKKRKLKKRTENNESQEHSTDDESVLSEDESELSSLEDEFSSFEDLNSLSEDEEIGSSKTLPKLSEGLKKKSAAKTVPKSNKKLKKKSAAKFPSLTSNINSSQDKSSHKSKLESKNFKKDKKTSKSTNTPNTVKPADFQKDKRVKKTKELALTASLKKIPKPLKGVDTFKRKSFKPGKKFQPSLG